MKLLTAQQIREWDQFTIQTEPISSIDLMERAASRCVAPILEFIYNHKNKISDVAIFCGRGNNGGDGLAIARMIGEAIETKVFILAHTEQASSDFLTNEMRLKELYPNNIYYLKDTSDFPVIEKHTLVIDTITGTGLISDLHGIPAQMVEVINASKASIIAIDMPSGLFAEVSDHVKLSAKSIIKATKTLTFQLPKFSFLHVESAEYVGDFEIIDIELHPHYLNSINTKFNCIDSEVVSSKLKPRLKFAHKGTFGHLLTIGGSYGKMGAAVLMSKSGLRTGCGLVSTFVPKIGYTVMQTALPEVMVMTDDEITEIRNFPLELSSYDALVVGPGLGLNEYTIKGFTQWLTHIDKPILIDADALNICARNLLEHPTNFKFPKSCIITPHPKEFDRMVGISNNSYERLEKQIHLAQKFEITVVLKGAHTTVAMPDGRVFFNLSGNVAMATAGSGDVLSGIIGSLLAQGYSTEEAALIGVYLHGMSGDIGHTNKATLIATDIIEMIPIALNNLFTQLL